MSRTEADLLNGVQAVADFLGWSVPTLQKYARRYPPRGAKLNGRWKVRPAEILAWLDFVKAQELRHPEARRFRPAEPPELTEIRGRAARAAEEDVKDP